MSSRTSPRSRSEAIEGIVALHPAPRSSICQNRWREKAWLKANGFPHARYAEALEGDIGAAALLVGPSLRRQDGRLRLRRQGPDEDFDPEDLARARRSSGAGAASSSSGSTLSGRSRSSAPGRSGRDPRLPGVGEHPREPHPRRLDRARADQRPSRPGADLAAVGDRGSGSASWGSSRSRCSSDARGGLVVNELAPRPHNSGHWSIDGA
jgi:5-(carboxyamino)imidazole ribonucleotide synthase